MLVILGLWVV